MNNIKIKRAKKKDKRTEKFNKFGKYNRKSLRVKQEAESKAKDKRVKGVGDKKSKK